MLKNAFEILYLLLPIILFTGCERDLLTSTDSTVIESLSLLSPAGGERYSSDKSIVVRWKSSFINDSLRIELINDDQSIYSVNNVPNSGHFIINIPSDALPSDRYQIKILLMNNPEIYDINQTYFEIAPAINGRWNSIKVNGTTGLELDLELSDFVNDSFTGSGYFSFTYYHYGEPVTYEKQFSIEGLVSYPVISFIMSRDTSETFNFTGEMSSNTEIGGRLIGYIDPVYGSLNDTLTLHRR
jgi:hypothetical protein